MLTRGTTMRKTPSMRKTLVIWGASVWGGMPTMLWTMLIWETSTGWISSIRWESMISVNETPRLLIWGTSPPMRWTSSITWTMKMPSSSSSRIPMRRIAMIIRREFPMPVMWSRIMKQTLKKNLTMPSMNTSPWLLVAHQTGKLITTIS